MQGGVLTDNAPGVDVKSEAYVPTVVVVENQHHSVVVLTVEEVLIFDMAVG